MRRGQCDAIGCRAVILHTEVFCSKHWAMLESDLQRIVAKTFRPGVKHHSARFLDALTAAQREILFFQTNGHRRPADTRFEWDDPPEVLNGAD